MAQAKWKRVLVKIYRAVKRVHRANKALLARLREHAWKFFAWLIGIFHWLWEKISHAFVTLYHFLRRPFVRLHKKRIAEKAEKAKKPREISFGERLLAGIVGFFGRIFEKIRGAFRQKAEKPQTPLPVEEDDIAGIETLLSKIPSEESADSENTPAPEEATPPLSEAELPKEPAQESAPDASPIEEPTIIFSPAQAIAEAAAEEAAPLPAEDVPKEETPAPGAHLRKKPSVSLARIAGIACITGFFVLFGVSCYKITEILVTSAREKRAFEELASVVSQMEEPTSVTPQQSDEPALTPKQEKFAWLKEQNPDFYGWVSIADTPLNYPVMYTPAEMQYYLRRDFHGATSKSGTPFLDTRCTGEGRVFLIYGHDMKNETMFGSLKKYEKKSYWEQHPTIRFDTLEEEAEYEIVAVVFTKIAPENPNVFPYYRYVDLRDDAQFAELKSWLAKTARYDTGLSIEQSDTLLVLSTCSSHVKNGRTVVFARKK